jgi:hypothetical protein
MSNSMSDTQDSHDQTWACLAQEQVPTSSFRKWQEAATAFYAALEPEGRNSYVADQMRVPWDVSSSDDLDYADKFEQRPVRNVAALRETAGAHLLEADDLEIESLLTRFWASLRTGESSQSLSLIPGPYSHTHGRRRT